MFWNWKNIYHRKVDASDKTTGKLVNLIFDQIGWAIRYISIDSSTILFWHHEIIISSLAVKAVSSSEIKLQESYNMIENSKDIAQKYPLMRISEKQLHDYYGWKYYWDLPAFTDSFGNENFSDEYKKAYLSHIRLKEGSVDYGKNIIDQIKNRIELCTMLTGINVQSVDEEVGKIDDFIVDDNGWVIRYLICSIQDKVLPVLKYVPILLVTGVDIQDRHIYLSCSSEKLRSGVEYFAGSMINRDLEKRMYEHFELKPYWKYV